MQELNAQISNRLNFNYLDKTLADDSFGDGFHLPKSISTLADMYKCETESIASSATSKRRIDLLFGETRSVSSEYHVNQRKYETDDLRKVKSLIEGNFEEDNDDHYYRRDESTKNDVQVRIEKMFSEISSSEQETENTISTANQFAIQHLGSIPVHGKITSVDGLQVPLKELYFNHKSQPNKKNGDGLIQIGDKGLHIEYNSNYGGKIDKLYSFSNIAIWASLKFSHQVDEDRVHRYAFLPIVANSDKSSLYNTLDEELAQRLDDTDDAPLFVVVMREPDTPAKQLVCHGFVCQSSEDAVVLAATLYRILVTKLGGRNRAAKNRTRKLQRRRSTKRTPASTPLCSIGEIASSNEIADSDNEENYAQVEKRESKPPPLPPPPPPPPTRPPRKLKQKEHRNEDPAAIRHVPEGRDVLTKVTIPRSASFLNTNRLRSRYQHLDPKMAAAEPRHATSASPLGFVEMFNELQSQEGLKTIDEILRVIIKSEGMSFNELKPIYKEFLLKLALVLSKDELYDRSKAIMKSQQQKARSKSASATFPLKKVIAIRCGLKSVLCKPLIKLKREKKQNGIQPCSSCTKNSSGKLRCSDDGTSTDSFMLTDTPKIADIQSRSPTALKKSNSSGNLAAIRQSKPFRFRSQRVLSTSEDSDYPNVANNKSQRKFKNKLREDALRPSSSGYFSFSECSYDTESCTCVSADKCYCSLSKNKMAARVKPKTSINCYSTCSCDTIACRKRNKCYCTKQQQPKSQQHTSKLSLVEQLKQKGFAVSESSLSPDDTHKKISSVKDRSNTKLSKSLEYLESGSHKYKNRMELYDTGQKALPCKHTYKYSPSYSSESSRNSQKCSLSSDNLAVDYSMFAKPDERVSRDNVTDGFAYRGSKRMFNLKPNVVYAELARPKLSTHSSTSLNQSYAISPQIRCPAQIDAPSMSVFYPQHTSVRGCNCTCSCKMYSAEPFPTYKSIYGSTPFHGMNMENVFGYFP